MGLCVCSFVYLLLVLSCVYFYLLHQASVELLNCHWVFCVLSCVFVHIKLCFGVFVYFKLCFCAFEVVFLGFFCAH